MVFLTIEVVDSSTNDVRMARLLDTEEVGTMIRESVSMDSGS
jgi:hypothetical protein